MPGFNLSLGTVKAMSAGACAALLFMQSWLGPINIVVVALLFPIFLVSVSVLSYLLGDGLYMWDRGRAVFARYDSESHPIRALLYFLFLAAGDAFFVVVFFRVQSGMG